MLLDTAYHGKFNIDFKPDKNGFNIPVYKSNGSVVSDISKLSSGQRVITKSALCLGLIDTFIGKYDIMCLDELDAALDSDNRRAFLDIINQQVSTLGLEQVFIISHNQEFFSQANLGLILFPNHTAPLHDKEFLERVTIIKTL